VFRSRPPLFLRPSLYYGSCLLVCRRRLQPLRSGVLWSPGDTDQSKREEDGKVHEERREMRDPVARPARRPTLFGLFDDGE
jgi:hypothetical protein